LLLTGHSRPITVVKYNQDGDLLFTASKESSTGGTHNLCLWLVDNGERVGTYLGHTGAVYSLDVTRDSKYLLTGSADSTVRLWEALTGRLLATIPLKGPSHGVAWAEGEKSFAVISNKFMTHDAQVCVYDFDPQAPEGTPMVSSEPKFVFSHPPTAAVNYTRCLWMPMNDGILLSMENGSLRHVDLATRSIRGEWAAHTGSITSMCFNDTKSLLVTTSKDKSAALWDVAEMAVRNRYFMDVPLNAAALSSFKEHVILGGGVEAREVTTSAGAGKFETRFFDLVQATELGRVKGHFGPVNSLDFSPDGWGFCSGAEDGFVRLHKLDDSYIKLGEEDNLDDPALAAALEDGTFESLEKEEEEELAKGKAEGSKEGGKGMVGGGGSSASG
jgi:translation initiation factor 3 subunit I